MKKTENILQEKHFTYLRQPVAEPPFEIVRNAGRGWGGKPATKPQVFIERDGEDGEGEILTMQTSARKSMSPQTAVNKIKNKAHKRFSLPGKLNAKKAGRPKKDSPEDRKRNIETLVDDDPMFIHPDMLGDCDIKPEQEATIIMPPVKKFKSTARKSTTQKAFKKTVRSISPG